MADPPIPRRLVRAEQVLRARTRRVAVVVEGAQDPLNAHAVLRTSEALGFQDVHLVAARGSAAGVAPGVSQGAHSWLTLRRHESIDTAVRKLRGEGRRIWAAALGDDARPLSDLGRETGRIAVLFGNETNGLSTRALELADERFRIDLLGFSGSLNLSVAAAMTLWELRREDAAGDLDEDELAELRAAWLPLLLGRARAKREDVRGWLSRVDELKEAALGNPPLPAGDRRRDDGAS